MPAAETSRAAPIGSTRRSVIFAVAVPGDAVAGRLGTIRRGAQWETRGTQSRFETEV